MTRVKICGLTRERDRDVAVAADADAIGLIAGVTVDTPREIDLETAADLADSTPPLVTSVLVTMPESESEARERIAQVGPDAIQLHAADPALVAALDDAPAKVVVAVDPTDEDLAEYAEAADALLVDSVDAKGGGGTGETHDWERTRQLVADLDVPVILAGGLTPENVERAVETVGPFAVDVASGVEREGGIKDHDAVRSFIERATRARVAP
ncbi:phosphoribosylanthranilate isomerase [Halapricum salinum]|uniref:N-(5'-phosphoribosyl)anthranilate isomerase n=1 Tax=Halapricum salinum TaxID=1457250 RepID=A0A4D6HD94_9EURY|nr:phosphoribosylanthranilate isomerase [Halapricum salinum]QCC51953.1 phosphoribosylanthranilate isomerase [Halapricum salinum]